MPDSMRLLPLIVIDWIRPLDAGTLTARAVWAGPRAGGDERGCARAAGRQDIVNKQAARNRVTELSCKRLVSPFANPAGRIPRDGPRESQCQNSRWRLDTPDDDGAGGLTCSGAAVDGRGRGFFGGRLIVMDACPPRTRFTGSANRPRKAPMD